MSENEFTEETMHPVITVLLLWLRSTLALVRIYGFAVVISALCYGIIGGYAGLFGAMTISGAVLAGYLVQRALVHNDNELEIRMYVPAVITICAAFVLSEKSSGLLVSAYAAVIYGLRIFLDFREKDIVFLNPFGAWGGIAICMFAAVYSTAVKADISSGILMLAGGMKLFEPLLETKNCTMLKGRVFALLRCIRIPLTACSAFACAVFMKSALDDTLLFHFTMTAAWLAVNAFVLAVTELFETEETNTYYRETAALAGSLTAAALICTRDAGAGIAAAAGYMACHGALVLFHHLKGGSGEKAKALQMLLAGLMDMTVLFVCLLRYNGISCNLKDVIIIMCIMLSVTEITSLDLLPDIEIEEKEDEHE